MRIIESSANCFSAFTSKMFILFLITSVSLSSLASGGGGGGTGGGGPSGYPITKIPMEFDPNDSFELHNFFDEFFQEYQETAYLQMEFTGLILRSKSVPYLDSDVLNSSTGATTPQTLAQPTIFFRASDSKDAENSVLLAYDQDNTLIGQVLSVQQASKNSQRHLIAIDSDNDILLLEVVILNQSNEAL